MLFLECGSKSEKVIVISPRHITDVIFYDNKLWLHVVGNPATLHVKDAQVASDIVDYLHGKSGLRTFYVQNVDDAKWIEI